MKSISGIERHAILNLSDKKRAFVVGDIHGEYNMLKEELVRLNFDEEHDVLISVGDLVDRGPQSEETMELIDKPWFFRTLGNHEVAPRMYLNQEIRRDVYEERYGAAWLTGKTNKDINDIAIKLKNAPVSLTVLTPKGNKVGIVHADCLRDWNSHVVSLHKTWIYDLSLWSRVVIDAITELQANKQPVNVADINVANIDHVFSGHTHLAEPFTCGNRSWIDTGAAFGGKLTVWDIDAFLEHKSRNQP